MRRRTARTRQSTSVSGRAGARRTDGGDEEEVGTGLHPEDRIDAEEAAAALEALAEADTLDLARRCTPARPRGVVPPAAAPCLVGCCEAARTGSSTVAAAAARRQSAYRLRTSCTCGARRARRQRLGQTRSRGAPEDIVHLWSAPISDVASRVHAGARRAETTSRGWWREERHGAERRMACRDDARTCIRRGRRAWM